MKAACVAGYAEDKLNAERNMLDQFNDWVDRHPHCEVVKTMTPIRTREYDDKDDPDFDEDHPWVFTHVLTFFYVEGQSIGDHRVHGLPK